jgi:hypothetical protein
LWMKSHCAPTVLGVIIIVSLRGSNDSADRDIGSKNVSLHIWLKIHELNKMHTSLLECGSRLEIHELGSWKVGRYPYLPMMN